MGPALDRTESPSADFRIGCGAWNKVPRFGYGYRRQGWPSKPVRDLVTVPDPSLSHGTSRSTRLSR